MTNEVLNQIIEAVLGILVLVISGIVIPKIKELVSVRISDETFKSAVDEMLSVVDTTVSYIEQTMVKNLKRDGKWDSESQVEVLEEATGIIISTLSKKTYDYFNSLDQTLEDTVKQYIEANILNK